MAAVACRTVVLLLLVALSLCATGTAYRFGDPLPTAMKQAYDKHVSAWADLSLTTAPRWGQVREQHMEVVPESATGGNRDMKWSFSFNHDQIVTPFIRMRDEKEYVDKLTFIFTMREGKLEDVEWRLEHHKYPKEGLPPHETVLRWEFYETEDISPSIGLGWTFGIAFATSISMVAYISMYSEQDLRNPAMARWGQDAQRMLNKSQPGGRAAMRSQAGSLLPTSKRD